MSENLNRENVKKRLVAEIVSIGDEITSGSVVDTNSAYLSRQLSELGLRTLYHTTVGDEMEAMADVFALAVRRADLVVVTGGLGPTEDDLTRQAAAQTARVELVQDSESLEQIRRLFAARKRPMTESNVIQSYFPAGSEILPNPNGTAPGFALTIDRRELDGGEGNGDKGGDASALMITFPGVPAEMREMWNDSGRERVERFITQRLGVRRHIQSRSIHCFGAGENDLESRLPHLIARGHIPRVGITASSGVITLRITAEGVDFADCQRQLNETAAVIYERVGEFVFGEGNQTLASVAADLLRKKKKTLGVVEWGTAGFLSKQIAPEIFAGALIDSSDRPVCKTLELPFDAEPETILRAFAERIGAPALVAVGRYPSGEELQTPENALVSVYALDDGRFASESYVYGMHPSIIDTLFANRALNLLRRMESE